MPFKSLAFSLIFILSAFFAFAADITVEPGNIYSEKGNELFISLRNSESGGHDYRLVSAGSLGGIGTGKFGIYDATAFQTRLTIDADGNVGIGTIIPSAKFEVIGNLKVTGGHLLQIEDKAIIKSWLQIRTQDFPAANGDYTNPGDFYAQGKGRLDGQLVVGGSVGIGIASNEAPSPGAKLDVRGPIFADDGMAGAPAYSFNLDPNMGIYRSGNDKMTLVANGQNALTVDGISGTGNVGIGTISPGSPLTVRKTTGGVVFAVRNIFDTDDTFTISDTGQIKITGGNPGEGKVLTSDATGLATWQTPGGSGGGLPASYNGQTLRHDGTSWVANSNIFNDGTDVGIGTDEPTSRLHIGGLNPEITIGEGSGTPTIRFRGNIQTLGKIYVQESDDTLHIASDSESIIIDAYGNVGIGVTPGGFGSPRLHITDTMRLQPRSTAPSSPASGDIYIDSTPAQDELCFYDGVQWQGISSGTDANCA